MTAILEEFTVTAVAETWLECDLCGSHQIVDLVSGSTVSNMAVARLSTLIRLASEHRKVCPARRFGP